MPSIQSAFPSTYLRTVDLGNHKVEVTISHLKLEDVGNDGERKPVLYFQGKDKGVVLNKTRAAAVSEIAGTDDYGKWPGVKIVLSAATTMFKGKTTPCIGISAPTGQESSSLPADEETAPF